MLALVHASLVTFYFGFLIDQSSQLNEKYLPADCAYRSIMHFGNPDILNRSRVSERLMHLPVYRLTTSLSDSYIIKHFFPDTCPRAEMLAESR